MKGNKKLFLIFTILITIIEHFLFYEDNNNCPKLKCSSSGICVDNYAQCPTPMACGKEFKKINQFTCSKYDVLLESQKCTKITCWNNDCVNDTKLCPTMSSCPNKYLIKCHDNSCVENLDDCPKYVNCPKFIPIRCPNGDCRRNFEDCPSLTQCPSDFPILCNDNSCRITAEECEKPAENTRCIGRSMVRCSDGTCKSSKFLCTTPKTCPIGKVLCFNGICADYYQDCLSKSTIDRSTTCSSIGKLRCELDGSCRNDINDCPTSVICPVERPVKCWDNSCKENIHKCPPYQTCPINFLECPNGTCIYSKDGKGGSCGTMITCSLDAPFKCKDNTCKRTPNDCESNDDCPTEKPVLCWDGSCVSNRIDCIKLSDCDISKPVRCPDFQCRSSVEECKEISGCPLGFVRCDDKTCKRKSSDCNVAKCPINFPFMCKLGNCVKNIEECDVEETACPFYAPIKCENSSKCVDKQELCPDNENKSK